MVDQCTHGSSWQVCTQHLFMLRIQFQELSMHRFFSCINLGIMHTGFYGSLKDAVWNGVSSECNPQEVNAWQKQKGIILEYFGVAFFNILKLDDSGNLWNHSWLLQRIIEIGIQFMAQIWYPHNSLSQSSMKCLFSICIQSAILSDSFFLMSSKVPDLLLGWVDVINEIV